MMISCRFRRILALILALAMVLSLASGCGRRGRNTTSSREETTSRRGSRRDRGQTQQTESGWEDIPGWNDGSDDRSDSYDSWEDSSSGWPEETTIPWYDTTEPATQWTQPPTEEIYVSLPSVPVSDGFRYHRSLLSGQNLQYYDEILDCLLNFRESTGKMVLNSPDHLNTLFFSVLYDYPELFYVRTYVYYHWDDNSTYQLKPEYLFTREEALDALEYMENSVSYLVDQLRNYGEFDKAVAVYTYLVERFTYDLAYTGATLYKVLRDDVAVCEGYAKASQFLLNRMGVENIYVTGPAIGPEGVPEPHAWNMVKVNGKYYNFDATWGEMELVDGTQTVRYNYCLMPDQVFQLTHFPDEFPYPACDSLDFSYYVRSGTFLTYYDPGVLFSLIGDCPNTLGSITFQCLYQQDYVNYLSLLQNVDYFWHTLRQQYGDFYANRYQYYYDDDTYVIRLDFLKTNG